MEHAVNQLAAVTVELANAYSCKFAYMIVHFFRIMKTSIILLYMFPLTHIRVLCKFHQQLELRDPKEEEGM